MEELYQIIPIVNGEEKDRIIVDDKNSIEKTKEGLLLIYEILEPDSYIEFKIDSMDEDDLDKYRRSLN